MLRKSHMTEQERQNCISNLTIITCTFTLSKAAHLLIQGEGVVTEPVVQVERPAQQGEMVIRYSFGWATHQNRKQEGS